MNDCQVCGQDFESNEELGEHVKIHPEYDQRNVLCAKCGKRYALKEIIFWTTTKFFIKRDLQNFITLPSCLMVCSYRA